MNGDVERAEQLDEFGELVERGGVDTNGVEVANDQPVAFGASERVGKDLCETPSRASSRS